MRLISSALDYTSAVYCLPEPDVQFNLIADHCQHVDASWNHIKCRIKNISHEQAVEFAMSDDSISYFVYVKATKMCLESEISGSKIFYKGEAIFFTDPYLEHLHVTSAPGLADVYVKQKSDC